MNVSLSHDTREVTTHFAWYTGGFEIAVKNFLLTDRIFIKRNWTTYLIYQCNVTMNCIFQGGLAIRSLSLIKYFCDVFAYTDHAFDITCFSRLQERKAARLVLRKTTDYATFIYVVHSIAANMYSRIANNCPPSPRLLIFRFFSTQDIFIPTPLLLIFSHFCSHFWV